VAFKLPIELANSQRAAFLGTMGDIYLISLFEWKPKGKPRELSQEFYLSKTTKPMVDLRKKLNPLEKERQRILSKSEGNPSKDDRLKLLLLSEEGIDKVKAFVKENISSLQPVNYYYSNWNRLVEGSLEGARYTPSPSSLMQDRTREHMWRIGKDNYKKSWDEMRTPQINAWRRIRYVSINYFKTPFRDDAHRPALPPSLISAISRQILK
jgi:hypothetical protein